MYNDGTSQLFTKEKTMGRKPVDLNKTDLANRVREMESGKYNGLTEFWIAVGKSFNVSSTTVMLRAKKWGIVPAIESQRGQGAALAKWREENISLAPATRTTRGEKIRQDPEGQKWIKALKNVPELKKGHAKILVEKTENGSVLAALALKCLECTVNDREEIRNCVCIDCPLWYFRPYKNNEQEVSNDESVENETVN